LVMDRNHDGVVNDGSELFGSSTTLADGEKAANAYVALAELDTNHDGLISSADASFADLRVWVDANADGVSSAAELKSLDALGITQVGLAAQTSSAVDNGNRVGLTSSFQTSDGANHVAADVWFAVQAGAQSRTDLGSRVSSMAQAIGAFDSQAVEAAAPSADPLAAATYSASVGPLAIASLVDVMRQFDANGKPVGATSLSGAFGEQTAGWEPKQQALVSVDLRPKTDLASPGSFAPIAMPK